MATQRNGKWIPVVDNHEMEVFVFKNHDMVKIEYETKEEAEKQEKEMKEVIDTLE